MRDALLAVETAVPGSRLCGQVVRCQLFGGRFGPATDSPFIDVHPADRVDAVFLRRALPMLLDARWRVLDDGCPVAFTIDELHLAVADSEPLLIGTGRALADADAGRLVQPATAEAIEESDRDLEDVLSAFPGLDAPFLGRGATVLTTTERIEQEIAVGERGGRRRSRVITSAEQPWVELIMRWHEGRPHPVEPVPFPAPGPGPDRIDGDPWTAPDPEFRDWVIDQVFARPAEARDSFLNEAIAVQRGGPQKPTHQGWDVARHGITALLMVDTGRIRAADMRSIRVATVLHDLGKVHNVWTRGAHARIGARLWTAVRPTWLTDDEAELVGYLIAHHDMLGFLDRGLKDHDYPGGLCPTDVRAELAELAPSGRDFEEGLRLVSTIYHADISAVPTLRWLRGLTPLLEQVVRAGWTG